MRDESDRKIRQDMIRATLDPRKSKIVEIGALDSPTFPPKDHNIRFIDYATKEQLLKENPGHRRYTEERLVEVDYPIQTLEYSQHISERFDLAVANHVIEHVSDTIRWLEELRSILVDGGYLFLSVPDRRYTFDYLRPETTIVDVLRAHHAKNDKPDVYQIFEHFYYYRPLKAPDVWGGQLQEKIATARDTIAEAWEKAERLAAGPYVSVHCHAYTYRSFLTLLQELRYLGLVGFDLIESQDVREGKNEFYVLLRKVYSSSHQIISKGHLGDPLKGGVEQA